MLTSFIGAYALSLISSRTPIAGDLDHGAEVLNARLIDGKLYVVGRFQKANRKTVNNVAVWDGTSWSGLGKGVDGVAYDICKVGSDLYVCGDFSYAGKSTESAGVPANRIARWDGSKWNALATNTVDREIYALATDGKSLFVGGNFTKINNETETRAVAKWNGTKFEAIGGKFDRFIKSMVWLEGKLYVGGYFQNFGDDEMNNVAIWDGSSWSEMGNGGLNGTVSSLTSDGKSVYAAGKFNLSGKRGIAKYDGGKWALSVETDGLPSWVMASGSKLCFAGDFRSIAGKNSYCVGVVDGGGVKVLDEVPNSRHSVVIPFKDYYILGGSYSDVANDQIGGVLKWNGSPGIDKLDLLSGS